MDLALNDGTDPIITDEWKYFNRKERKKVSKNVGMCTDECMYDALGIIT